MEIGDKIVCKRNNWYGDKDNPQYHLKKYHIYTVKEIYFQNICKKQTKWVKVYESNYGLVGFLFDKYFYTEKELRKVKLMKVSGSPL